MYAHFKKKSFPSRHLALQIIWFSLSFGYLYFSRNVSTFKMICIRLLKIYAQYSFDAYRNCDSLSSIFKSLLYVYLLFICVHGCTSEYGSEDNLRIKTVPSACLAVYKSVLVFSKYLSHPIESLRSSRDCHLLLFQRLTNTSSIAFPLLILGLIADFFLLN